MRELTHFTQSGSTRFCSAYTAYTYMQENDRHHHNNQLQTSMYVERPRQKKSF